MTNITKVLSSRASQPLSTLPLESLHDSALMRKMATCLTWQNGRRQTNVLRRPRGASFSPLAPRPMRERRRLWRNFAVSIGGRSMPIFAARATPFTTLRTSRNPSFTTCLKMKRCAAPRAKKAVFAVSLLGSLKLCLADEHARQHALKRGGGVQFISLDELMAEELHFQPRATDLSPAESLDARWAGVILERALEKVRAESDAEGKAETFELLSPFLAGEKPNTSYQDVAQTIGLSLAAVKTQIHRLRRRFATAVRCEIMQTVAAPHEVENELRQLRDVFARVAQQSAL